MSLPQLERCCFWLPLEIGSQIVSGVLSLCYILWAIAYFFVVLVKLAYFLNVVIFIALLACLATSLGLTAAVFRKSMRFTRMFLFSLVISSLVLVILLMISYFSVSGVGYVILSYIGLAIYICLSIYYYLVIYSYYRNGEGDLP